MAQEKSGKDRRTKVQNDSEVDNWRTQLRELNARSRMYATQLWALPFLYLTAIGLVLSLVEDTLKLDASIAFTLFVLGILVFAAMMGTRRANDRAVQWIAKAEKRLGLPQTVQVRHGIIDWSYYFVVLVAVAVMSFLATQQVATKVCLRATISLFLFFVGVTIAVFNRVKCLEKNCSDP